MPEHLDRRLSMLQQWVEQEMGEPAGDLVFVALVCNRCGTRREVTATPGPVDDEFMRMAFEGWHLTADPADADLCPACAS